MKLANVRTIPHLAGVTRDAIIASIGELSVTPRVVRYLSALLKDVDQDPTAVIEAIALEPVLVTAIIAAANAPTHSRGERTATLSQAVYRLGFRETYRIALLITFRQGLPLSNLPDNHVADHLWRRAITAACAMEELPGHGLDKNTAYTIGLLHLIGCLLLARGGAERELFDCSNPAALARAQAAAGGLTHPEVAALALDMWNFPPEVCAAVRWQYSPHQAGAFLEAALQLSRAANLATFIEECRPDSPIFRKTTAALPASELERRVEMRAFDLMALFHVIPPRRPAWAIL
jgi:HD-like signal output (HDOD) protein